MILVDTSVWIAVFRARQPLHLEDLVPLEQVVTCPPIIQEVLQGFRVERAFRMARDAMLAMPVVESPMETSLFLEAAELYRAGRRHGITIRSSVDCLVAACALRHDLPVLHGGRDYDRLAQVCPLKSIPASAS